LREHWASRGYRALEGASTGHPNASVEAFKAAIRARSRDPAIRNLAFSKRAKTYAAQREKAMGRKDLERVLGADSTYAGVRERLRELEQNSSPASARRMLRSGHDARAATTRALRG
jgi:hypothetical protein